MCGWGSFNNGCVGGGLSICVVWGGGSFNNGGGEVGGGGGGLVWGGLTGQT